MKKKHFEVHYLGFAPVGLHTRVSKQKAQTQGTWIPSVILPFLKHVTQVKGCSA